MLSFKNWINRITTCITQIKAPVTTDKYQNILMVYYLAGVGGTRCTPTNRVLGWGEVVW